MTGQYVHFNRRANMCSYIEHFENEEFRHRAYGSRKDRMTAFQKPNEEKEGKV
jgi:hypothetical protein